MAVTFSGGRHRGVRLFSRFKVAGETDDLLVLQRKRIAALLAAAFAGVFGGVFAGVALHFYPGREDVIQVQLVGILGGVLLAVALMFLYFGLRRPDRIVCDRRGRQVRFESTRKSKRRVLGFDELERVELAPELRRMGAERVRVHVVRLHTRSEEAIEVDVATDLEEMIRLAARLRRVTELPLAGRDAG